MAFFKDDWFSRSTYAIQTLLRDMDPEGTELEEDTDLEEEFIVILTQIMPGISTGMISLNLSVVLFMAQSMVTVGKFSG